MKYYIINRTMEINFGERICDTAEEVAVYLWGKRIDHYHILREDDLGLRVVPLTSADIARIKEDCERHAITDFVNHLNGLENDPDRELYRELLMSLSRQR